MKEVNREPDDQGQHFDSLHAAVISMGCSATVCRWRKLPPSRSAEDLPAAPQPQVAQSPAPSVTPSKPQVALVASFPRGAASQMPAPAPQAAAVATAAQRSPASEPEPRQNSWPSRTIPGSVWGVCSRWRSIRCYRETRAAELPNFNGAITAVDANEGSRIGAGSLTASRAA